MKITMPRFYLFIGQVKKKNPNVNPNRVREICLELIEKGIGDLFGKNKKK